MADKKTPAKKATATAKKPVAKKAPAKKASASKNATKTTPKKVATRSTSPKKATTTPVAKKVSAKSTAVQKPVKNPMLKPGDPETTGIEWDGIQEFNNPVPRWMNWTLLLCLIFSIGYVIYYPSWPMPDMSGYFKGIANWTSEKRLQDEMAKADASKAEFSDKVTNMSIQEIAEDSSIRPYAVAGGKATFALHCSQCHGAGGAGAKGFPNLLDDEWLWGGSLEDIRYTITHGIRSYDDWDTRDNMMSAFGTDEILSEEEITSVVSFVEELSSTRNKERVFQTHPAATIFQENCTACHGEKGEGISQMGAPALNNKLWLYGGDTATLTETVTKGRGGHMPAFGAKLTEDTIKKLAIYVHSLSGGQN